MRTHLHGVPRLLRQTPWAGRLAGADEGQRSGELDWVLHGLKQGVIAVIFRGKLQGGTEG
jgi:hypothetical protein